MVRAMSGDYDAIMLDRRLPGIDGLTILKALRAAGVETPVMMLSAMGDVDERICGLQAGGDDYLTKPFNADELIVRIEVMLRRGKQAGRAEAGWLTAGRLCQVEGRRLPLWIKRSYPYHVTFSAAAVTVQPCHVARRSWSAAR
jgi:two-component system OmpR family response regulator